MNALKLSLCAVAATAAMGGATAAFAEDGPTLTFNTGAATDYIFRGLDQTGPLESGEAFGGVDLTYSKFYAGTWVSNTGPRDDNGVEYDIYGGYKPSLGPVGFDLGFYFYGYNDSRLGSVVDASNTLEWKVGASMPLGGFTVGAVAYYSNDFAGSDQESWYEEGDVSYTFKNKATVSGAVGGFQSDALAKNYVTWNLGVTYPVTDHVSFDLRYIGTNADAKISAPAFSATPAFDGGVATLKVSF